jgi:hypothetical protein
MRPICVCVAWGTLALSAVSSAAQPTPAQSEQVRPALEDASLAAAVQTMGRTIERQQQLLEEQGRQLERLRNEIAAIRGSATPGGPAPVAQTSEPPAPSPLAAAAQASGADRRAARDPELPPDQISATEFPGSFAIPGSDAALKIGGLVRVNWVSTYDAMLVDDRFQASAIPIAGTPDALRGGRVNVIASPSRFNFDLRTPTGVGHMRASSKAISPAAATRCGCATRMASGTGPSSVRRGPPFLIRKRSPTGSTSRA